jgi:ribonuclease D
LDVEYLSELRELLAVKLDAVGKRDFATQEFAHVRDNTMPIQRTEPWRRTSGLHKVTKPADLAVVRALWQCRDQQAALADIAPGRLLPDAVIVALALSPMRTFAELRAMPELASRVSRRHITLFVQTVLEARTIPTGDLPEGRVRGTGLPPPRQWATRNPQAHARLVAVRDALSTLSVEIEIPVENLMTPELVRRVIWEQPQTDSQVREILESGGARPWQIQLVEPLLLTALG